MDDRSEILASKSHDDELLEIRASLTDEVGKMNRSAAGCSFASEWANRSACG